MSICNAEIFLVFSSVWADLVPPASWENRSFLGVPGAVQIFKIFEGGQIDRKHEGHGSVQSAAAIIIFVAPSRCQIVQYVLHDTCVAAILDHQPSQL